jgi:hypothetical protein
MTIFNKIFFSIIYFFIFYVLDLISACRIIPLFGVRNEVSVGVVSWISWQNNLLPAITVVSHAQKNAVFISPVAPIVKKRLNSLLSEIGLL